MGAALSIHALLSSGVRLSFQRGNALRSRFQLFGEIRQLFGEIFQIWSIFGRSVAFGEIREKWKAAESTQLHQAGDGRYIKSCFVFLIDLSRKIVSYFDGSDRVQ